MDRLRIQELREWMGSRAPISPDDLRTFYGERGEALAGSTLYYRLSRLKEQQVIVPVGRGQYRLVQEPKPVFSPQPSVALEQACRVLETRTLGLTCGFWSTEWLQGLVELQRIQHWAFIEPEKGQEELVYWKLRDEGYKVFLRPDSEELDRYAEGLNPVLIVRPLISEAPLAGKGIAAARLEKILVDLLSDKLLQQAYDRNARQQAFRNAFAQYQLSLSALEGYARRRNRQAELQTILTENHLIE